MDGCLCSNNAETDGIQVICRTSIYIYIRIMEKNMDTAIVYWGYTRMMEKNMEMETTP